MIEEVERDLLLDVATYADLKPDDIVCEFGSYLGRSARCLAEGLQQNARASGPRQQAFLLHVFDVFSCAERGAFAEHLLRDCRRASMEGLLKIHEGRIDFAGVFDHFMRGVPTTMLCRHQTPIALAKHPGGTIALMHVDAPKWYSEYRELLSEFGPHLRPGAQVVLQDYFYHWSAELIAAVQVGINEGYFTPQETAASSLLVRVERPVELELLAKMDGRLCGGEIEPLIREAIALFSTFEVDRPEQFLARLYLAAMQSAFERGDHSKCSRWLQSLQQRIGDALPPAVIYDLADLVRYGFSLRKLYELDMDTTKV